MGLQGLRGNFGLIQDYEDLFRGEGDFDSRWYAAQTTPGCGGAAEHHLSRQGFQTARPRGDGQELFPGYIFIKFSLIAAWQRINSTRGVRKLIPIHREEPLPLPDGFVEEVLKLAAAGGFGRSGVARLAAEYVKGEKLYITDGAFSGFEAEYEGRDTGSVLIVLCSLFGRKNRLKIEERNIDRMRDCSLRRCGSFT